MKIYISGPISGQPLNEVTQYFTYAATKLSRMGHDPVNPLKNGLPKTASWEEHMKRDITLLLECDAICMVGKWWESKGAILEWQLAQILGIKQYKLNQFTK